MDGIIIINKPEGWTSFDVCAKVRNLSETKKVGHSGTLDPFATGVLPVFLGKSTKSISGFLSGDKGYTAEMTLGVKTDTMDLTGKVTQETKDFKIPEREEILKIFGKYIGDIEQLPPMYSAVKINGQRLYKLARKGIELERDKKKVKIHSIELLDIISPNKIRFHVLCSKGTYIRVLASDIGDDLGCGAHLSFLERTYSHPFHIPQALSMETIVNLARIGKLESVVLPVEDFLGL